MQFNNKKSTVIQLIIFSVRTRLLMVVAASWKLANGKCGRGRWFGNGTEGDQFFESQAVDDNVVVAVAVAVVAVQLLFDCE